MLPPDENDDTADLDPNADDSGELEPNEDIIERMDPGKEPLLLWVQTCPGESCPCRTALVVAAQSREQLDAHVAIVRRVWEEADDADEFEAQIPPDMVVFELDIDSGEVTLPMSEEPGVTDVLSKVAEQIDGDLLDRLASQWYLGKEQEDAATLAVPPSEIRDYTPGQLLAWDEVHVGARADIYSVDGLEVEAIETFCVRPKCQCNDVHVQFYQLPAFDPDELEDYELENHESKQHELEDGSDGHDDELDGHVYVGSVSVVVEDPVRVKFVPAEGQTQALERLFACYKARYPSWAPRLAKRAENMAAFGERLHVYLEQQRRKPWVSSSRKHRGKRH